MATKTTRTAGGGRAAKASSTKKTSVATARTIVPPPAATTVAMKPAVAPKVTRRPRRAAPVTATAPVLAGVSPDERRRRVARAAYFRAQARGFSPGNELDDWLAAEREIDAALDRADN